MSSIPTQEGEKERYNEIESKREKVSEPVDTKHMHLKRNVALFGRKKYYFLAIDQMATLFLLIEDQMLQIDGLE